MPEQANLTPVLTADEINEFLAEAYPQLNPQLRFYKAVDIFPGGCTVRLNADERHLRPGGTVSGPSLFTLADIGGYVCVLAHAGPGRAVGDDEPQHQFRAQGRGRPDRRPLPHPQARQEPDGVRHRHRGGTGQADGRARDRHLFDPAEYVSDSRRR